MLDIKNRETLEIYVLGDDFKFYQNLKYLPLTSYPSNNQSALIIYCLGGKAKITFCVFTTNYSSIFYKQ